MKKLDLGPEERKSRVREQQRRGYKKHYEKNKHKIIEKQKEYREKNLNKVKERAKKHYEKNKKQINERHREWAKNNPDSLRKADKKWKSSNKEKISNDSKARRLANLEKYREAERIYARKRADKIKEERKNYRKSNAAYFAAASAARRALKKNAIPSWADLEVIKKVYEEAKKLMLTVDHIVPLKGENVCGLHVENNLQLLTLEENISKHNKWPT